MIPYFTPPSVRIPFTELKIHAFGVLVALGILIGVPQVVRRARQLGLDPVATSSMCTWVVIVGFVVSHVFEVVTYRPAALLDDPWLLLKFNVGISSFGGFLGALLAMIVWVRRRGERLLPYADATIFGLIFGWVFGRIGCFTAHDHPGRHTDFFLGVDFGNHPPGGVRHDLGLYEAIFTIALALLFQVLIRRSRPAGTYLVITTLLYGPVRFLLDFLRVADQRYFGLTPAQYGSLVIFAVGCVAALRLRSSARS